jgi:spermidine synthase
VTRGPPTVRPSRGYGDGVARIEELAWQDTPLGEINLRRRQDPVLGRDVYEVKLGDEFLMSSAFTAAEEALARLALAELSGSELRVAVGGLGLGYTAAAVLEDPRVGSLVVIDALKPVIDWHEQGLIPSGAVLVEDPRCRLVEGDFFALVRAGALDVTGGIRRFDAVVVDIDHSPTHVLDPANLWQYTLEGTRALLPLLVPGGVFALWSNDPPDAGYTALLQQVFDTARADVVAFPNPLQGRDSTNTVYVAIAPAAA